MASYSQSSTTGLGFVINAVFNTETNLITYTVTTPQGVSTSATAGPNEAPPTLALTKGLRDGGQQGAFSIGITNLNSVKTDVTTQARQAETAATATNTPVPESPQPPPPASSTTNPAIPPPAAAPATVTPTNTSPAPVTEPAGTQAPATPEPINGLDLPPTPEPINGLDLPPNPEPINGLDLPPTPSPDEFGNLDQAIERQQASTTVLSEDGTAATGVLRNTETGEVFYTDPPKGDDLPFDEFAGVDEAVAEQQRIAVNTSGLPVRAEDGSVAEGVAINPETGETYFTAPTEGAKGLAATKNAREQATKQDQANFELKKDWRVRLSLTPGANYLYKADPPGILAPLAATDGIIFPYTPNISVNYAASYEPTDLTHTNYKVYQYKNSNVDNITITCEFTAQDTYEANYLLAVIHFFRSVTKMFYGQDNGPTPGNGTPPPLCYLYGLGAFQFEAHPLAITNFTYNLPVEVDYIRATTNETTPAGVNKSQSNVPNNSYSPSSARLQGTNASPGAVSNPPQFAQQTGGTVSPTYVPTKMQISISAVPIISRNNISNYFSLKEYATGKLLRGVQSKRGGIW